MSKKGISRVFRLIVCFLLPGYADSAYAADPVVTNVRAEQKRGTKLVEIHYDMSGSTSPVHVSLQVSSDGGTSFAVPMAALNGDIGANIPLGRNKSIVWNAGTDWNNQVSNTMKFRVTASDTPPAPDGFVFIPPGSFTMGQDDIAPPPHSVYVSGFYMGKYEVTKELWDDVRAWGVNNGYTDLPVGNGSSASKGANHPVHSINWFAMVKWCNARSDKEGVTPCYTVSGAVYKTGSSTPDCNWSTNGYRLPTEAEWEKAARGGLSGRLFSWGTDTISHSQANYSSSANSPYDVSPTNGYHPTYAIGSTPYTSPVGSFAPNGYGLYDMTGNIFEWCWDWFSANLSTSQSDPRGPLSGTYRVRRGGSWNNQPRACCVANRDYFTNPSGNFPNFGFRLVRSHFP